MAAPAKEFPDFGGFVTSPNAFVSKDGKFTSDGLFSECIFGPKDSYRCSCGNYNSKVFHSGQTCPKCGVKCDVKELRAKTFGKIKIPFPVVNPSKHDKFLKIIENKNKVLTTPIRVEVLQIIKYYLAVNNEDIKLVSELDPHAKLYPGFLTIPFRITGLYSLYIVMKFASTFFNTPKLKELFDNNYMTKDVKVLPPDLRLITYDSEKKEYRTPQINKMYTSIINLNKINIGVTINLKQDEEDYFNIIKNQITNRILDQEFTDSTLMNTYDVQAAKYQYHVNEIYRTVYEELSGKLGLIRNTVLSRTIEFSARSVVTTDPSLPPYEVKVSKKILKKLWIPYFLYYLTQIKQENAITCYDDLLAIEDISPNFNVLFDEFLVWFCEE